MSTHPGIARQSRRIIDKSAPNYLVHSSSATDIVDVILRVRRVFRFSGDLTVPLISGIGSTTPPASTHTRTPDPQVQQATPVARSQKVAPAEEAAASSSASRHKVDVKV
jgi:hypothetical protein